MKNKVIATLLTLSLLTGNAAIPVFAENESAEGVTEQVEVMAEDAVNEPIPETEVPIENTIIEPTPEIEVPAEEVLQAEQPQEADEPVFDVPLLGEPVFPEAEKKTENDFELFSSDFSLMASSGSCGKNVTYTLDDAGTLTISGTGAMNDYNYYTPSPFYNNTKIKTVIIESDVTSIGSVAFYGCTGLTSITIPDSVTSIGSSAFYGCTGLTSITIPDSVTSIGKYAFRGCTGLTSITIPDSVTSIGSYAFEYCTGLKSITIPDGVTSIGSSAFSGCSGLTSITIPYGVTSIGSYAFSGCSGLTSITIPYSVTSIGDRAFAGCSGLTSITIPYSVTSIGPWAFRGCSGLKTAGPVGGGYDYKFGWTKGIPSYAFYDCTGLTSITIPDSVTSIGSSAFSGCSGLIAINVDEKNKNYSSIDGVLFNKNKTELIRYPIGNERTIYSIPDSVTSIGDDAFRDCSGLTSITIPDSVTSIDSGAFYGCTGLTSITIPESVTSIGNGAFYGCSGLTSITIPDGVTSIGRNTFSGCSGLTSITIPESVTSIGDSAFEDCSGLTSITIPYSVTSIGEEAFYGCSGLKTVYYTGDSAQWGNINIGFNNNALTNAKKLYGTLYPTENGYMAYKDGIITSYSGTDTSIAIPSEINDAAITGIADSVFKDCVTITSITIPDSVTSIGSGAFRGCSGLKTVNYNAINCSSPSSSSYGAFYNLTSIETVNIGDNVTNIPSYTFYGCSGLTSITIGGSVTSIGYEAFYNCNSLKTVNYNAINCSSPSSSSYGAFYNLTSIETVNIGDNVTNIPSYAFYGCSNLQKVNLTENTETIGKDAFKDTPFWDNITDIYFGSRLVAVNPDKISDTYTIKEGTTKIANDAFNGCTKLISVNMPNSLTAIGDRAFKGCTWLSNLNMPASVQSIGEEAFEGCTWLRTLNIGSGVTDIGKMAFANCSGITKVTIPASVENIGELAFESCTHISRVDIADLEKWCKINFATETSNPLYFANEVYINNNSVSVVEIPNGVTSIGSIAFCGCKALTGVKIPSTVSEIGSGAFYKCSNLNDVYITDIAKWCETDFEDAEANPMSYAKSLYVNNEKVVNLTIPNTITKVSPLAFYSCEDLETVNIQNSLENDVTIGANAFGSCSSLYIVTLPYCITDIDSSAFDGSDNIVFYVDADSAAYNYAKNMEYVLNGGRDISSASVEYTQSMMYSGKTLTPTVSVKLGDKYLTENTDFKVWYLDNVNIGTAKILIYGIGNYRGYIEKTFEIRETNDITELYIGENAVVLQGQRINLKEPKSTYGTIVSCTVQHDEDKAVNFTPNNYYSFSSYGVYKITYQEEVTSSNYIYGQGMVTTSTIRTITSTVTVLNPNDPPKEPSASVSSIKMQANECNEKNRAYLLVSAYPAVSAEQTIRFRSSDTSVLTVDQYGVVTFVKPGKATVYAETVNGTVGTFEYDTAALNINSAEIISLKQDENNEWKVKLKNKFGNLEENTDYTAVISENENTLNLEVTGIGLYGNVKNAVFDISTGVPRPIKHSILTDVQNGEIILDKTLANDGEKIVFKITPTSGYRLIDGSLKVNGGNVSIASNETGYSFIMPDNDVTITAEFEKIPPQTYTITTNAQNGTIKPSKKTSIAGESITFAVTPSAGYMLTDGSVKVNNGEVSVTSNGSSYSFTMPDKDVTITAAFEKIPPEMVTVTFNAGDGTLKGSSTMKVEKGKALTQSGIPTAEKDGYKFSGWLLNGKTFSLDTPITENITLTALWVENEIKKSAVPTLSKYADIMNLEKSEGENGGAIFTVIKKGNASIPNLAIYVAHFGTDGTLQSVDKFDFTKNGDTYTAIVDKQTGNYKLFIWTDDAASMLEPITAPLTAADRVFE